MSEAKLIELARLAEEEGDQDTAIKALERLKQLREETRPSIGERALGTSEVLGTMATGAIAEPISGLVGVGGLAAKGVSDTLMSLGLEKAAQFMDPGDLSDLVQGVQSTLTHSPQSEEGQRQLKSLGEFLQPFARTLEKASQGLGDPVMKATGSPALAATAASIPEAALELMPGLTLPKGLGASARGISQRLKRKALDIQDSPRTEPQKIVDTIKEANNEGITIDADLDPTFFKAVDELGINTAPLASYGSQSFQYRDIEQLLASLKGSSLGAQGAEFISETSKRAAEIIDQMGGAKRGDLSTRFEIETGRTVDDLFERSHELYNIVDSKIDNTAKVDAKETIDFANQVIKETGGSPGALITKLKKELETVTQRKTGYSGVPIIETVKQPTYGNLVRLRQEVGEAIGKNEGPFRNQNKGFLKKVYSKLREDQDRFALQSGAFDELKAADELTIQRKVLEDNLKSLLGSKLTRSLEPVVANAMKGLQRGETTTFDRVISKIPDEYKQPAVATALREVMSGSGKGQADLSPSKFVAFMDKIPDSSKNRIFKHLPDNGKHVKNLYEVAKGISRATGQQTPTGISKPSLDMFNGESGFMRNLVGGASRVGLKGMAIAAGGKVGPTGAALASNMVDNFLNQTTSRAKAASELLASDQFRNMIKDAVRDGVQQGNVLSERTIRKQALIEKSESFKRWADTFSDGEKSRLASLGLVLFLIPETEE
jgi:polyhydroxyalkanoate synthesis regulator phasin